jgi:hypothetical protein
MVKFALLILASALAFGCGRHHGVNTGRLAASFQTAEPTLKAQAEKAIAAIKAGNFTDATTELQQLARRAKLSAEQQQTVRDTIAEIEKQVQLAASKAAADAKKALPQKK